MADLQRSGASQRPVWLRHGADEQRVATNGSVGASAPALALGPAELGNGRRSFPVARPNKPRTTCRDGLAVGSVHPVEIHVGLTFGLEEVNRRIAAGGRVSAIKPAGAIMNKVGEDEENVSLVLGGCQMQVVFEDA